jgi:multisubunit Na+/H+ antiporter MnhB subunit
MKLSSSFIFTRITTSLFFGINIFAVYLLLRGHNFPGGGFIAGLGTGMSLILLTLAIGVERMHRILRVDPVKLATVGLLVAMVSSSMPILWGDEFLKQYNFKFELSPILGSVAVGTPLMFDIGVYLVVVGVVVRLIAILARPVEGLVSLTERERALYASPLEKPVETEVADLTPDDEEEE